MIVATIIRIDIHILNYLKRGSHCQSCASFSPSPAQDPSPVLCLHPSSESVGPLPADIMRSIGNGHNSSFKRTYYNLMSWNVNIFFSFYLKTDINEIIIFKGVYERTGHRSWGLKDGAPLRRKDERASCSILAGTNRHESVQFRVFKI